MFVSYQVETLIPTALGGEFIRMSLHHHSWKPWSYWERVSTIIYMYMYMMDVDMYIG